MQPNWLHFLVNAAPSIRLTRAYFEISPHTFTSIACIYIQNEYTICKNDVKLHKIHRGKIEPTQAEILAGDVVSDNNIDLLYVAKLYRYYRGVEESLK